MSHRASTRWIAGISFCATLLGCTGQSKQSSTRRHTAPLQILQGDLATFRPEGCEEYDDPSGIHSARIRGDVFENIGDNALIVATDFRAFADDYDWESLQEWRVLVGERVKDVTLFAYDDTRKSRVVQAVTGRLKRCILFIESTKTFVPPITGPPPAGPGAVIGKWYAYTVMTHCGVTIVEFNGRWWKVSPPVSDDPYNPPPGWNENNEHGTIRLVAKDKAEFRAANGDIAHLVPTRTPTIDPNSGCE